MDIIPIELLRIIFLFTGFETFYKLASVCRSFNYIFKLNERQVFNKEVFKFMNKIIKTYTTENIVNFNTNSTEILQLLRPQLNFVLKVPRFRNQLFSINIQEKTKLERDILICFEENYYSHFEKNEKIFEQLPFENSFVTTILYHLYH